MTATTIRLAACALTFATLAGCMGTGQPMSTGQEPNDPSFSGVTNTDALDGSYTPDSSAL